MDTWNNYCTSRKFPLQMNSEQEVGHHGRMADIRQRKLIMPPFQNKNLKPLYQIPVALNQCAAKLLKCYAKF